MEYFEKSSVGRLCQEEKLAILTQPDTGKQSEVMSKCRQFTKRTMAQYEPG